MTAQTVYLPNNVQIKAVGKIADRSVVQPSMTGIEYRLRTESVPKRSYQIGWNKNEVPQVENMFKVFGRHAAFLVFLPRPTDHTASEEAIGTGDGAATDFQLTVTTTLGSISVVRNVLHPKSTTVLVAVDGTAQTEGVDYTVNYSTGVITFGSAPADSAPVVASFDYYTAFYFDSNELSTTITRVGNSPQQEIGGATIIEAPNE